MTPPISKDWWAAAAAVAGTVPVAMGQVPPAPPPTGRQQAGIVTTAAPQAPSGIQVAPLFVDVASNQRVVNNTQAPMHILFSDQSALTLAPGAEVMIAQYRWDQAERRGNLAVNLFKGVLRVVGGQISKINPTQVRTATATVGIRGGISVVEFKDGGETNAKFLFGEDLTFTLDSGTRPTGGSSDAGPSVEEFRQAGWFTDGGDVGLGGGSGDSGQDAGQLRTAITTVLTQPGWQAAGGGALLATIQTGTFSAQDLQTALNFLAAAGAAPATQPGPPGTPPAPSPLQQAVTQLGAGLSVIQNLAGPPTIPFLPPGATFNVPTLAQILPTLTGSGGR